MTKEEAIKIIDCYDLGFYDLSEEKIPADKLAEAFDMAIDALQRTSNVHPTHECIKPTHECVVLISKQAAIEAIEMVDWYHLNQRKEMVSGANSDEHQAWYKAEDVYEAIEAVPSESKLAFDGTLIITVDDYSKVNRVIVKDESHFGCVFEPADYDEEDEEDWYDRRDDERRGEMTKEARMEGADDDIRINR